VFFHERVVFNLERQIGVLTMKPPMKAMLKLLLCFESRCAVGAASTMTYGTDEDPVYNHPDVPGLLYTASQNGWVEDFMQQDAIPPPDAVTKGGIPHVFFMDLELTAAGREICGLPPIAKAIPAPVIEKKKKTKPEKPKSPSLFDDF
jgi:hypothetical protein